MTIELPTGVTVHVEFPSLPQVCPAPEAPQPGGVTVPVQGSLTAEQLAHIVSVVTAKVVEELGGQPGSVSWETVQGKPNAFPPETHEHPIDQIDGLRTSLDGLASDVANRSEVGHRHNASDIDGLPSGGGGAGIDDTTIGTDTTWSSQKTSDELAGKADDKFLIMDSETGELTDTGEKLAVGVASLAMYLPYYVVADNQFSDYTMITIGSELPEYTEPGQLYGVRDPDTGVVTFHTPSIPA